MGLSSLVCNKSAAVNEVRQFISSSCWALAAERCIAFSYDPCHCSHCPVTVKSFVAFVTILTTEKDITAGQDIEETPFFAAEEPSESDDEPEEAALQSERRPATDSLYPKKAMKAKKKEFLARRKQRKKPVMQRGADDGSEADSEEDVEARLMKDVHKPAFGEQAMQPLKVSQFPGHLLFLQLLKHLANHQFDINIICPLAQSQSCRVSCMGKGLFCLHKSLHSPGSLQTMLRDCRRACMPRCHLGDGMEERPRNKLLWLICWDL